MIKLKNVTKKFKEKTVLNNIDVSFEEQAFSIITGESGCGKTTLLNVLCGYLNSDLGSVEKDNHKILYNMVDDMNVNILSVFDNMKLVTNDYDKINEILKALEIDSLKKKKVSKLSKGEQVRVSIARALLSDFDTLLFDEPTGNLDYETAKTVFELLKKESSNKTIIVVTHDKEFAETYADFLYELKDGDLILVTNKKVEKKEVVNNFVKPSSQVLYKYARKKAYQKPILYGLAFLLMVITALFIFISVSFSTHDPDQTAMNVINSLDKPFFNINRDNDFENYNSVAEYKEGKEIATKFSLKHINRNNYYDVNAAFYEELKDMYNFPKPINEYEIDYENKVEGVEYYPIIINSQIRRFCMDEFKRNYKIGEVFEYTFEASVVSKIGNPDYSNVAFVIVDILEVDGTYRNHDDIFPVIISKEAYIQTIERNGIYDNTILNRIFDIYHTEMSTWFQSPDSNLISKDKITDLVPLENLKECGYFYVGNLPQNENEIMIDDFEQYYLLTGQKYFNVAEKEEDSNLKPFQKDNKENRERFLEKYKDGFPVSILEKFNNKNKPIETNIKVVGCFGYMQYVGFSNDGKPDYVLSTSDKKINYTIISDELYKKLEEDILEKDRNIYNIGNQFYFSKTELTRKRSDILNGNVLVGDSISKPGRYPQYVTVIVKNLADFQGFVTLMASIALAFFAISLIVVMIYFNNCYKSMMHDFAILTVYGKTKKDLIKILLMFTAITVVPATLISIPVSVWFLQFYWQIQLNDNLISNADLSLNYALPTLSIFGIFIFYALYSLLPLLKFRKKDLLGILKND